MTSERRISLVASESAYDKAATGAGLITPVDQVKRTIQGRKEEILVIKNRPDEKPIRWEEFLLPSQLLAHLV
jgi:hypothetical protein